ncbi:myo-inositol-1(or 4)-monophosphatase [Kwoniella heveanensis CBS 569]|nr:myo-inositol-1(or 4)-monophosphatase [Kwoniella heveanensis CBS 569]
MEQQYQAILDFAYQLAERASDMILKASAERWTSSTDVEEKANSADLVTKTDQAVEEMIKTAVADKYPTHKFIGEESYAAGDECPLTDEFTWIVDPVDGTMNFVHSNPFVACSIGVTHLSQPVVGVIALPFFNQIYSARQGGGAFMNRTTPLPLTGGIPQPLTELSKCMIGTEWGSHRSAHKVEQITKSLARLIGDPSKGVEGAIMTHALRNTGSSACTIAAVAAGQNDMYWYAGCYPWDVCAGAIILSETGGFFHGGKDDFARDAPIKDVLMSRRYVFVRAVPPSKTESAQEIQRRLVKELYDVVEEWDIAGN